MSDASEAAAVYAKECNDLRAQLAEARAEIERLCKQRDYAEMHCPLNWDNPECKTCPPLVKRAEAAEEKLARCRAAWHAVLSAYRRCDGDSSVVMEAVAAMRSEINKTAALEDTEKPQKETDSADAKLSRIREWINELPNRGATVVLAEIAAVVEGR